MKRRYWLLGSAVDVFLYVRFVRPWHLRWGTEPGDFVDAPWDRPDAQHFPVSATHAIAINVPAERVWPWVAQIGQGRGGFYSCAWFENLLLSRMTNADRIHPEWQDLQVGDIIRTHPKVGMPVREIEPGRYMLVGDGWWFWVRDMGAGTARLVVRNDSNYTPDFGPIGNFFYWRCLYEPLHFLMERGMLRGLKARAEAAGG